jgi:hypothetical protein
MSGFFAVEQCLFAEVIETYQEKVLDRELLE